MLNLGRHRLFAYDHDYSTRTIDTVREALVIDMLSPFEEASGRGMAWYADTGSFNDADEAKLRGSGIDVFHPSIGFLEPGQFENSLAYIAALNSLIAARPDVFQRIDQAGDMAASREAGRLGVLLGLQTAGHFRTVDDVNMFFGLGQRVGQLTYNTQNRLGSGSTERVDGGVSDFGVAVIERMNSLGMVVDLSHCGDRTTMDAIELSSRPVLFTHSNCRALVPGHPRCKTDEAIRALAARGGVMGITGVRNFVLDHEPTTIEHIVDHIDHVANVAGIEHVGIGSDGDLDGYDDLPPDVYEELKSMYKGSYGFRDKIDIEGFDHPRKVFDLTEALYRRGHGRADISLILGGNFQRVLDQLLPARS